MCRINIGVPIANGRSVPDKNLALVVVHPDQYFEVFGPRELDVFIAVLPDVKSVRGEVLGEEYLDQTIPVRFRRFYAPGLVRAAKLCRSMNPHKIADVRDDLCLIKTIDTLGKVERTEATTWTL